MNDVICLLAIIFIPSILFATVTYFIIFSKEYEFNIYYRSITGEVRIEYIVIKATNYEKAKRKAYSFAKEICEPWERIGLIKTI